MRYALALLAILLTGCQDIPAPIMTQIQGAATQNAGTATADIVPAQSETPTASVTSTAKYVTQTPTATSSIVEITPCGAYICERTDNQSDIDMLARLCVVEVRGFGSTRDDACVSVVSTVVTRIMTMTYSDGTVRGTLLWHCDPNSCDQFPGYVVNGCDGILPTACPWTYQADIVHFRDVVDHFLRGRWGPGFWCSGYIYYDSRPSSFTPDVCTFDKSGCQPVPPDPCAIQSDTGAYEVFHR